MSTWYTTTPRAKAEAWEAGEEIITVEGLGFLGGTLSRGDARVVARWLNERGGMHDLLAAIEAKQSEAPK